MPSARCNTLRGPYLLDRTGAQVGASSPCWTLGFNRFHARRDTRCAPHAKLQPTVPFGDVVLTGRLGAHLKKRRIVVRVRSTGWKRHAVRRTYHQFRSGASFEPDQCAGCHRIDAGVNSTQLNNVNASTGALTWSTTLDGRRPVNNWARRGRNTILSQSTAASTLCDVQVHAADSTGFVATVRGDHSKKKGCSMILMKKWLYQFYGNN